jgi:hypothetical protein
MSLETNLNEIERSVKCLLKVVVRPDGKFIFDSHTKMILENVAAIRREGETARRKRVAINRGPVFEGAPTCRTCQSAPCQHYGETGGFSVQCEACNVRQSERRRAAYAKRKGLTI